jgi:hypothetical protein
MINQHENRNRNRFNIQTLINTHYTSIVRLEIELDICCIIMYTKTHNVWLTGNISKVSISMLNIRCVVLIIYTKIPRTWPTVNLGIVFIIILNMNYILGKPLSHGVFQATFICCKLTWWPSTNSGCFKLHGEYSMSPSRTKPPIFTRL